MRETRDEEKTWPLDDATWRAFAERFTELWKIEYRRHRDAQPDAPASLKETGAAAS